MKKTTCLFIAVLFFSFLFSAGCDLGPRSFTEEDLSDILEARWQEFMSDKPNFHGGVGLQILSPRGDYFISSGLGDDVTNTSHFRVASVTKTFTAAAVMLLHQDGLLHIDDSITDIIPGAGIPYVPDTPEYDIPYKEDITIRSLLNHCAGVFDIPNNVIPVNEFSRDKQYAGQNYIEYMLELDGERTFTFDELVGVNAENQLSDFEPGTSSGYSNTGYSILGKIIERVSGKSYADFIRDELAEPSGLHDVYLPSEGWDQTLPEPLIEGFVWIDDDSFSVTESNMSAHVAEGNIITTPLDLANWGRKLLRGEAGLTEQTVAMMKKKGQGAYGLGLVVNPGVSYGHSGAHIGYLTIMYYFPGTDVAYVAFSNIWDISRDLDSISAQANFIKEIALKVLLRMGYFHYPLENLPR